MNNMMEILFGLFGGLAIFIFGMNMMSECLQKAAGEKMKAILGMLTKNPVMGVLAGALVTAVLQSSSATTVMAIGFVSAGLMTLPQAISIIFGANIGTTMTAQIIAFKISDYIYLFIFAGFIVAFISKSEKIKNIGQTVFAFGLLFLGIETMGGVMKPLASSPVFTNMIAKVADIPVLGVAVGALMTLVVQSSSATIAVLQNFASQPGADGVTSIIGLAGAIPILLGDNIGTTITALLASIGQPRDAKRTALAHSIFNISGSLLFIWFVTPFAEIIKIISPKGPEIEVISRQIANAHTGFNLVMTILWTPLVWLMVKIVMRLIPDGREEAGHPSEPVYLDEHLVSQPAAALQLVAREVLHVSDIVKELLQNASVAARKEDRALLDSEEQANQTAGIMYVLSDVERMGILCNDIADSLEDKLAKKYKYSKDAMKDLEKSLKVIEEMYSGAIDVMTTGNQDSAKKIRKRREKVLDLDIEMRKGHMERVSKGKCAANMTASLNNILHSVDRMGNCCVNIADAALGRVDMTYFIEAGEKEGEQTNEQK